MENQYLGYAWEQLYGTVSSLACDPAPLRERLLNAVLSRAHRVFPSTAVDELPAEINQRLSILENSLTKHGSFKESIDRMDDREVKEAIEEIFSIFNTVARAYPEL